MNEPQETACVARLRRALGSPPRANFERWRDQHGDAIAYLNPVVTATFRNRRRTLLRITSGAVAAAIIVCVAAWLFVPRESAFAQTVAAINKAESITWTIIWYNRLVSQDGKRTWLRKLPRWERSYLSPGSYRDVRYDDAGNIATVDIEDVAAGKVLHLDMKKKEATLKNEPSGQFGPGNPFAGFAKALEQEPLEFVGQRDVGGIQANVFRYRKEFSQGGHDIHEIWLDAKTKRLVGQSTTSSDEPFDPATAPDRDNPSEPRFSKGTIAGVIKADFDFDAQLDPKLFSLAPPADFKVVEPKARPKITEDLLIDWFRVSARANGDTFVDSDPKAFREWDHAIHEKSKSDRSDAEQQFIDLAQKHMTEGNFVPMHEFAAKFTEPRSFRYLGKGVKLGDGNRIVCFYKPKGARKYRAVYGDLKAKDVNAYDLPLPVDN
jgi:hypothetical protein